MATNPTEIWSPPEGAETLSPSRLSNGSRVDSQHFSSDGDDSATHTRRLNISPSPIQYNDATSMPVTTSSDYINTSYGHGFRPSSPSKLRPSLGSSASDAHSRLLVRPSPGGVRRSRSDTPSYTTPSHTTSSYTATPSPLTNTITQTWVIHNTPNTDTKTTMGSEDTFTRGTLTPTSTPGKLQSSPKSSPLPFVRNIVALWKERHHHPVSVRAGGSSVSPASPPITPSTVPHDNARYCVRCRVGGASSEVEPISCSKNRHN